MTYARFYLFVVLSALTTLAQISNAEPCGTLKNVHGLETLSPTSLEAANKPILDRLNHVAYPDIPTVSQLSIVDARVPLLPLGAPRRGSPGLIDPMLERARILQAFPDYKPLSDAFLKPMEATERQELLSQSRRNAASQVDASLIGIERQLAEEKVYLRLAIERLYDLNGETVSAAEQMPAASNTPLVPQEYQATYQYVEGILPQLFKRAPAQPKGSILETPYPFLIPAGRFKEGYYWDLYPAVRAMIATGRLSVAQMQVENLLHMVQKFGFVPNGWRDYYLSRSQPPFLSSMVREVYEASKAIGAAEADSARRWLHQRALPLLKHEHQFWMAGPRYNQRTGLNHHWDDLNSPRPERHSFDQELNLGETYRDTRAAAESGRDFTDAWDKRATKIAGPLLNAMLYKTEIDIARLAQEVGAMRDADAFKGRADMRRTAMNRYLWNEPLGAYVNYDLERNRQITVLGADTAYPLWAGIPTNAQAGRIAAALSRLEAAGGLMSSELLTSSHQWDGHHGWAPDQLMAVDGLAAYSSVPGLKEQSRRLAQKWLGTLALIHGRYGNLPESVDVARRDRPAVDDTKYPVQEGFLWTNATFVLFLQRLERAANP